MYIGQVAQIELPAGVWGCNQRGEIDRFQRLAGNPADPSVIAIVIPDLTQVPSDQSIWFILLSYDATGYVTDDEKSSLDDKTIDAMLAQFRSNQQEANVARRQQGYETLELTGWHSRPFFNDRTKNFTWALTNRSSGGDPGVNYTSRLLGRSGVMSATLVDVPGRIDRAIPLYENLMSRISFVQGNRYSEFKPGDKVAGYGLTALATGTTVAVAAKNWKGIVALGAAILAVLGGIVNWIKSKIRAMAGTPHAAPAAAAGASTEAPKSDAATIILTCRECGQKNRARADQSSPLCGKCGAKIQ